MTIEGAGTKEEGAPAAGVAAAEPDAFSSAFDDLTAPAAAEPELKVEPEAKPAAEAKPGEPAAEPAAKTPEEIAAEATANEGKTPEEIAAAAAAKPGDKKPEPAAAEPEAKPAATADDILKGIEALMNKPAPGAEEKPGAGGEQEAPLYNAEETAFLADYDKEWGDVVKGEALKRRAEYKELLGYVFKQVADFVKPLQDTAAALATRTHLADIETSIPDYSDQLRDDVTAWVKTQPAYLQTAYNQVINEGTVDEVKDLVDRYRGATGKAAPAAAAAEPKPNGKDNELSGDAKKAAAALAPVESKRSGIQAPGDPSDFDDAWKQAAELLKEA
jgi:hypothetical protein